MNTPEVQEVLQALSHGQWEKGRDLSLRTGIEGRMIRAAAEAADGEIISSQQGYRLTKHATQAERDIAYADLLSRACAIHKRARALQLWVIKDRNQQLVYK